MPEEAAALGKRRGGEIKKTGADIVISSCPFCEFHIAGHTDKPVKNITTLLLEGYKEKDRKKVLCHFTFKLAIKGRNGFFIFFFFTCKEK